MDPNADGEASARGLTAFRKLKDHRVNWEHGVEAVVKMDVERATSELLPFELKLVVMQVSDFCLLFSDLQSLKIFIPLSASSQAIPTHPTTLD